MTNTSFVLTQVQTIVDHHHPAEYRKPEPKVRFTEPHEQKDDLFNEEEDTNTEVDETVEKNEVISFCLVVPF